MTEVSPIDMTKTDRANQPEDFTLVAREREMERQIKDAADARNIGIEEEAAAAAKAVTDGDDPKNHKEKHETITIKKGFMLQLRDEITLVATKDSVFEVFGARTKDAIAGELATYPELYGAVRDDLAHTTTEDMGDGNTVHREITFGAHGVRTVSKETVKTSKGAVDTTPAPGLDATTQGNDGTKARLNTAQNPAQANKTAAASQNAGEKAIMQASQQNRPAAASNASADRAKAQSDADAKKADAKSQADQAKAKAEKAKAEAAKK